MWSFRLCLVTLEYLNLDVEEEMKAVWFGRNLGSWGSFSFPFPLHLLITTSSNPAFIVPAHCFLSRLFE